MMKNYSQLGPGGLSCNLFSACTHPTGLYRQQCFALQPTLLHKLSLVSEVKTGVLFFKYAHFYLSKN